MSTTLTPPALIVLLGPPGSGKGTQAELMASAYNLYHIDTGQALRQEITLNSDVGQLAQGYMDKGQLVPLQVVMAVIEAAMKRIAPEQQGYLMDGFPRNLDQAKELETIMSHLNLTLTQSFYTDIPHELLVDRLAYRQSCSSCGAKYNSKLQPTQVADVCDRCGHTPLTVRKDDAPEVIGARLEAYNAETAPLVAYYQSLGKCTTIDANRSIEAVFADIQSKINLNVVQAV